MCPGAPPAVLEQQKKAWELEKARLRAMIAEPDKE